MTRDPGRADDLGAADSALVEYHLRRLDPADCRALVADLWAARGFETTREGDLVVASDHGRPVRILPLGRGQDGGASGADRGVDVVVAPAGGAGARAVARAEDARFVDASDLRETLRYGVEDSVAAALCVEYLGAPPTDLPVPTHWQVRDHLRAVAATAGTVRSSVPSTAVVTVAVVLLAAGTVVGLGLTSAPDSVGPLDAPDAGNADAPASEDTATARATEPPDIDGIEGVPGMTHEGIANLTLLAEAHERAIGNHSYTIWFDTYRPRPDSNVTRAQQDTDLEVDGDRFVVESNLREGREERHVRTMYHDGESVYVAQTDDGNTTYRRLPSVAGTLPLGTGPWGVHGSLVARFMSTPRTNVTATVEEGGERLYRVEGTGEQSRMTLNSVDDIQMVALVRQDGLVRAGFVEYDVVRPTGSYRVRFEWTYGRIGETEVTPPAWFDERFGDGNGTAGMGDGNARGTVVTTTAANATGTTTATAGE